MGAQKQAIAMDTGWMAVLAAGSLVFLAGGGWLLWKRTKFA
jgi:LPXTG-motif cell wall-anchored protein